MLIVNISVCHVIRRGIEDSLWVPIFSVNHVGPRVGTEAVGLVAWDFTCLTSLLVPNEVFSTAVLSISN